MKHLGTYWYLRTNTITNSNSNKTTVEQISENHASCRGANYLVLAQFHEVGEQGWLVNAFMIFGHIAQRLWRQWRLRSWWVTAGLRPRYLRQAMRRGRGSVYAYHIQLAFDLSRLG